jgi:hypothetical protein
MKLLITALKIIVGKKPTQWIVKPKNQKVWFKLDEIKTPEEKEGKFLGVDNQYVLDEIGEIPQKDVEDMVPLNEDNPFAKIKNKKGWYPIESISDDNVVSIKELGVIDEDEIEDIAA